MYNLLLISHGNLAQEFLNTLEMIMGPQDNILPLGLQPEEGKGDFEKRISEACEKIYISNGVLILADLYGGTPCNSALLKLIYKYDKIQILTGLNLPMLIQSIIYRDENLETAILKLKQDTNDAICILNKNSFESDED